MATHSVQSLSRIHLFAISGTEAHQASLSITHSQSLLKLMSVELVMPFNILILYSALLLLPSIFTKIRVFSRFSSNTLFILVFYPYVMLPTFSVYSISSDGKDLERPSSTRLEARVPYHGSGAMTRSPLPLAWRPDFPGAPREAH